jgi:hypothetical protein
MSSDAQEYAEVIAQEVRDLDEALAQAYRYAFDGEGDAPTFDGDTFTDPHEVISHYFDALALEVLDVTARSWGSPYAHAYGERRYVEVLRTYGGPNVRVRFYGDGTATVRAYWGTDVATVNVHAGAAGAEVWELADAIAQAYA